MRTQDVDDFDATIVPTVGYPQIGQVVGHAELIIAKTGAVLFGF